MNEENNQNVPILGKGSEPNYPSGTYKIKFTDEYYSGQSDTGKQIKGRIMLLQNDDINGGNYFYNKRIIYDDVFIDEYVSHFDTENFISPIFGDVGFSEEHTGSYGSNIPDYQFKQGTFPVNIEYHFALDEEWYNKHYGDNSNKVLRTLATGQSDITRHEAYTKVQGLNLANANVPKYSAEATYEYVDLGLPSGTLWAKMNVGAKSETDYGLYFAWGETEGHADASTKAFSWADYKFNPSGDGETFTKYNTTDNKVVLDAEDDAASVNMGGEWHMPTKGQCEELLNTTYVTNTWVENYNGSGVNGRLFTSVSNSNTLFIPAAGNCDGGKVNNVGEWGYVWSSSLNTDSVDGAWDLSVGSDDAGVYNDDRCIGTSVRGVIGNIDK